MSEVTNRACIKQQPHQASKHKHTAKGVHQCVAARGCTATCCPASFLLRFSSAHFSNQYFIFLRDASELMLTVGIHFQQSCFVRDGVSEWDLGEG